MSLHHDLHALGAGLRIARQLARGMHGLEDLAGLFGVLLGNLLQRHAQHFSLLLHGLLHEGHDVGHGVGDLHAAWLGCW